MRVHKNVQSTSSTELLQQVSKLKQEGWRPGPVRVNIDAMYPHQCFLIKDIEKRK